MASGRVGERPAWEESSVPLAGRGGQRRAGGIHQCGPDASDPESLDRAAARLRQRSRDRTDEEPRVVLVGAGALGSQIHGNLSRMGWGRWTVVDRDTLLPHNVARHRLGEHVVGVSKVRAIMPG